MLDYSISPNGGPMVLQILADGKVKPIYFHDGRYFVAIRPGANVAVAVRNRALDGGRIEVLMSVDGRDVLVDQSATFQNDGMVVSYGQTWTNRGWRVDSQTVKPFVFTQNVFDTIAVQATGSTAKLGVIGVAVFEEDVNRQRPAVRYGGPETMSKGGMGMDDQPIFDPVGTTTFKRLTPQPRAVLEVQYRTPEELRRLGIILVGDDVEGGEYPSAFDGSGYGGFKPVR